MNKKILSTMVGAVLAGGLSVAAADITVFGHIDTSIDATDQDGGSDDINFHCNTCSIGFKGSEDLGNGLKAIFKLDFQYDVFSRDLSSLTDRDQWLGLAGSNWGQVRWGTISTPYKSHGAMIDPLYRTALQGRARGVQSDFHNGAGENLQGRADHTIRYDTPDWNGLKAAVFYTLDSNERDGVPGPGNPKGEEDNDPYGVGVQYSNGGLLGFADWMDNNGSKKDTGGDISAWKLGGKYMLNAGGLKFGFYGQYEDASIDEASASNITDLDFQLWHIAASAQMGNTMAYYAFGQGEYDFNGFGGKSDDYDTWTLAIIHNMSKRTKVYMGFSQVDCDARVHQVVVVPPPTETLGIDSSACGTVDSDANLGKRGEDDKFSIGMKHIF
jgi:predicted porin